MDDTQEKIPTERLDVLEKKIDAVYESVEKTRKYLLITVWVTIAVVAVPAIGLAFVIPAFLNSYLGALDGLL